jgi:hypothetical protein
MGANYSAVIPNAHVEVDASSSNYTCPVNTIAIRINDVTAGTTVQLVMGGGGTVTYDNLANGDELVGRFQQILAAGTACDSVIVYYTTA